ncbi:NtaA/DmoA family FMN-dependent monooxygenase [Bosea minatitlanensis]|uniref:NtaA/DmoA family FMN-dependent monooxygenase n=1 Tax=Bosea minatitlanensis TaxID=128782 RepID=A0ABW0F4C8_9HYPH|nr:NtaA/DmoA family FMN-dependent monooxygenase [Bosea minatitlanensis]MCT4496132.1 NtaA/DmoA family FMN-dependent monooxygenase [Bosea minatitlanensis]
MAEAGQFPRGRQLHIGLSLSPTWLKGRPADHPEGGSGEDPTAFYLALTRMAERAKLDFVFKADYLVMYPGMGGGAVGLDPTLMMAAIARGTDRIGLVTTVSTSFNPPFVVARQIQSLHWISRGRAGLNIVTSIEGAENFGDEPMPPPETRYRKAAEFTDVMRRLWRSYPHEALSGAATAAAIDHRGSFFSVRGPLNIPAHPAGQPPLFQAGASEIGRDFSSSIADATFAAAPDREAAVELRGDLRRRAQGHGRSADSVRVLPGLYFFLAATREEAWALHARAHAHLTPEQRRKSVKTVLGLDLGDLAPTARVTAAMLPPRDAPVRSRTHAELLRRFVEAKEPTVTELLARPEVVGSAHWVSVGTVDDVLADIVDWFEAGALDGFIALPGGSLESLRLFLDELVPALVRRGLFRAEYQGTTLREHLRLAEEG